MEEGTSGDVDVRVRVGGWVVKCDCAWNMGAVAQHALRITNMARNINIQNSGGRKWVAASGEVFHLHVSLLVFSFSRCGGGKSYMEVAYGEGGQSALRL